MLQNRLATNAQRGKFDREELCLILETDASERCLPWEVTPDALLWTCFYDPALSSSAEWRKSPIDDVKLKIKHNETVPRKR